LGIRPQESLLAGGVILKEVNMGDCRSEIDDHLLLCGSTIDVHGFDGGFNPLADFATGYVAAQTAIEVIKAQQETGTR
jgi:predicted flavoprotein YhiN